jgi:hypothetical protein
MSKWNANPYYPEKPETVYPEQPAVMLEGYVWRRSNPMTFELIKDRRSVAGVWYLQRSVQWIASVAGKPVQYFDAANDATHWCEMMVLTGADE